MTRPGCWAPNATGDRLAKLIPEPIMGRTPKFKDCPVEGTALRKAYDTDPEAKKVLDVAQGLEDIVRSNLDPCRRGRGLRQTVDRDRARAAGRGPACTGAQPKRQRREQRQPAT